MELRHLRYFVAVAEELHFGRAAALLRMTQPALSKQVVSLERELGVQLLDRNKRVVQLTAAGQVFLERAKQLLSQADETIQLTQRTARGEVGQPIVGFTATAAYTVLPDLVRQFRDRFPAVELTMQELCTEAQVTALNRGDIDLGFLHPPIDQRGLSLLPIWTESFVAVLPTQHQLLQNDSLSLSDLANEAIILHPRAEGPVLYDQFVRQCQQVGFQPQIVKEVGAHQTRICLVAAGMGITFVPESVRPLLLGAAVECRPIDALPLQLQFAAVWQQNRAVPTLRELLAMVRETTAMVPTNRPEANA
jgi:DNA-binding transcriptional LysR family regulator